MATWKTPLTVKGQPSRESIGHMSDRSNNPIVQIAARVIEALACGNLDYREGRNGHKSRAEAAAALFDTVAETGTPGFYLVKSEDEETPKRIYRVHALSPDFSCECEDALNTKNNPTGICKHQIAAIMYHTIKEVLSELPDEQGAVEAAPPALPAPAKAPLPASHPGFGRGARVPLDDPELEELCNLVSASNYDGPIATPRKKR